MKIRFNIGYIILFASALIIDIVTKLAVKAHIAYNEPIVVIDGFFNIVYALNPGAAFGFLRNLDESYRQTFFIVITIIVMIVILFTAFYEKSKMAKVAYTLVLAGAAGNLIDRIHTGYVVDFIDWRIGSYVWPAFNMADTFITIGVGLLVIQYFLSSKRSKNN